MGKDRYGNFVSEKKQAEHAQPKTAMPGDIVVGEKYELIFRHVNCGGSGEQVAHALARKSADALKNGYELLQVIMPLPSEAVMIFRLIK